jgi:uncharacterized membrane protein YidH (DUF202 family)
LALPRKSEKPDKDEGLPTEFKELIDLVVTYAKQQTIDPLKQLARWVGYGVAGAFLVGLGCLLLGLALLRLLQTELHRQLSGDWSWVPYLVVVVFLAVVIVLTVRQISSGPGSKEH